MSAMPEMRSVWQSWRDIYPPGIWFKVRPGTKSRTYFFHQTVAWPWGGHFTFFFFFFQVMQIKVIFQMNIISLRRTYEKLRQCLNHLNVLSQISSSKVYRAAQRLGDLQEFKGSIYKSTKHWLIDNIQIFRGYNSKDKADL